MNFNKATFEIYLLSRGFKKDFMFLNPYRRWAIDWAHPTLKLGFEYEGLPDLAGAGKMVVNKSRHFTPIGYSGDAEKYSAAAMLGWALLRVTAIHFSYSSGQVADMVDLAIQIRREQGVSPYDQKTFDAVGRLFAQPLTPRRNTRKRPTAAGRAGARGRR